MKGSAAFSAKSRTILARWFLNSPSNMTETQTLLGEKWMLAQNNCGKIGKRGLNAPRIRANGSAPGRLKSIRFDCADAKAKAATGLPRLRFCNLSAHTVLVKGGDMEIERLS